MCTTPIRSLLLTLEVLLGLRIGMALHAAMYA